MLPAGGHGQGDGNMIQVALLQLLSEQTQEENLEKGISYCRQAKKMGADIALFPEMWNTGYTFPPEYSGFESRCHRQKQ